MGSIALASDPVSFLRNYKAGDKDVYGVNIKIGASVGEIGVTMTSTQTVKKVYENGDADLETAISDLSVDAMGQHIKPPQGEPTTSRVNKFGMPVGPAPAPAGGHRSPFDMGFMKYTNVMGMDAMEIGKPVTIDQTDPNNAKSHVKGTATLVSTENGVSKITSSLDITTEQTGETPMHIESTVLVGAGGKMTRTEAKITHLPPTGGMQIDTVDLTMERKS